MKRFLVFVGDNYYPAGGWHDFLGDFDTLIEAEATLLNKRGKPKYDWAHIVDSQSGEIIDG